VDIASLKRLLRVVIGRFALILFGILLAVLLVELVLRVVQIPTRFTLLALLEQQWEPDNELLLHLKPDLDLEIIGHPEFQYTTRTNSDGLRDEPFEGTFDIAAIGDSFTFGFGVEQADSWPSRLERIGDVRVANLGWAGWNSHVYPVSIERYAVPLEARIWIWAFVCNDLPESAGAEAYLLSGDTNYVSWARGGAIDVANLPFPWNLRSLQLITALIDPELFLLPNSGDKVYSEGGLTMRYGDYAWDVTDPTNPEVMRGWELTEAALRKAQALATKYGATLVVVFIPNREHVYWPFLEQVMVDVDVQQLDDAETRLRLFCDAHDIHYLNLLPGFRARGLEGEMLYFPADGHWNEAGHDLAAHLIYEMLVEERLLPRN
jgi:hypothetical protein